MRPNASEAPFVAAELRDMAELLSGRRARPAAALGALIAELFRPLSSNA